MRIRAKLTLRNDKMLAARERLGLTQQAVAELAGCTVAKVHAFEKLDFSFNGVDQLADNIAGVLELNPNDIMPEDARGKRFETSIVRVADIGVSCLEHTDRLRLPVCEVDASHGAMQRELNGKMAQAISRLSFREREVVKLRYGLGADGFAYTLEEVGHIFKATRERIRQIEEKAIRKLRLLPELRGLHTP